ncbi:hypothetical protein TCAL_11120 [Tigriopus californicus]|uniref:MSP domain-containing protein n=1 Tax=Tigriopus californicus TaxID=6832 RepID=A0A553NQV0_TIGCA|nr:motile sperm domain-containing protein 1-like [Tigriopus californicus]TRY67822.1 hypothetical protein TCAL_11120 [Tigriopus californicus]|eukprot:TCALIF_11120-PA protein Name:"Similar to Mospd1 Motile sperm domain-containing protein 1 (Mus musculus)" AED:0.04 eAED:0.04 QI:1282/1/1/1/1/1/3/376/232
MSGPKGETSGSKPAQYQVPVFVFPSRLDFYLEDQTTHKRILTLYNPYDMDVPFKVLCNNPKKYAVVEPEGQIVGQKCVDIVVRHVSVSPQNLQHPDKFRIQLYNPDHSELIGQTDVIATLHSGMPEDHPEHQTHNSHSLPHRASTARPSLTSLPAGPSSTGVDFFHSQTPPNQPNLIACLAGLVCIISLFLPTEGEPSETFKDYTWLHLTVNQKLVFAYVLGLVTMVILRTT